MVQRSHIGPVPNELSNGRSHCAAFRAVAVAIFMLISANAAAERVFFEMGIARVTFGFDVKTNQSVMRKWCIAAIAPAT